MKAFLFDLDSTLLEMDQDEFLKGYFYAVAGFVSSLGYDAKTFMPLFNEAAYGIIKNDGSMKNEDRFWSILSQSYPEVESLKHQFISFYSKEFKDLEAYVHKTELPNKIVSYLKDKGYMLLLATNPVFPRIATEERVRWAGLDPSMFQEITSYEECRYCKPSKSYYLDLLEKYHLKPEDCIMVGNDVDDDFSDLPEGIEGFYITDYAINRKNKKIPVPSYSLKEFFEYIQKNF